MEIHSSPLLYKIQHGPLLYQNPLQVSSKIATTVKNIPILSLDGGGSRIAYSLELATELEKDVGSACGDSTLKIGEIFKKGVVAGTSGGGLLSLLWNVRDPANKERALYSARTINEAFDTIAPTIFPYSYLRSAKNWIWNTSLYEHTGLKTIAKEYFKGALFKDALTHTVIPTYQMNSGAKTLFLTRENGKSGLFENLDMETLITMTAAAPTYFDPAMWNTMGFADGGLFANNPSQAAYMEASRLYGSQCKFVTCSLGTGLSLTPLDAIGPFNLKSFGWGVKTWAPNFLDVMFNASSQSVHEALMNIYDGKPGYYRWQSVVPYTPLDTTDIPTLNMLRQKAQSEKQANIANWTIMVQSLAIIVKTKD